MNIWLCFVPGSGASTVELILRSCTSLDTLPLSYKESFPDDGHNYLIDGAMSSHLLEKQFHPGVKKKLSIFKEFELAPVNIFTPITPMVDIKGKEVLEYVYSKANKDDLLCYLGPKQDISNIEFSVITRLKAPPDPKFGFYGERLFPSSGKKWELREFISQTTMQWYVPQMIEQRKTAEQLGFHCYDTLDIFSNLQNTVLSILYHSNGAVCNQKQFDTMCDDWSNNQFLIWNKWKRYKQYKECIMGLNDNDIDLDGDILLEFMIQYYLREQGIELKCYGLDTFPTSKEIEKYYE